MTRETITTESNVQALARTRSTFCIWPQQRRRRIRAEHNCICVKTQANNSLKVQISEGLSLPGHLSFSLHSVS